MLEDLYGPVPSFLKPYLSSYAMQRLRKVGMNCGVEYTSLKMFRNIRPYSRYEHSLHTAQLAWHFTRDRVQTLACLFHDIASPAFAHTVDFLHGDYLKQESTEEKTAVIIEQDPVLSAQLKKDGINPDAVKDYHLYPLCDNDAPKLSCDRLEYTLGNSFNYGFAGERTLQKILGDIESGEKELVFDHEEHALRLGLLSIKCGRIYAGSEDRYAMEVLAELLKKAEDRNILAEGDLYKDEDSVIHTLLVSSLKKEWLDYTHLEDVQVFERKVPDSRQVSAKKRYIDPWIRNKGRLDTLSNAYRCKLNAYLKESQEVWLKGVINENNSCGEYE